MAQHFKLKLSTLLIASTVSAMGYGSGFAVTEQSITGLGHAFAGSAAVAEDASTIFFNPAGLTQLKHSEIDVGLNYIAPKSEFRDSGSNIAGVIPLTGDNGGDAGTNAFVPNLYYSHAINDRFVFGLGINAPFGLVTEYNDTWQGRYHAVKSDMKTININPTIAFKATDKLSLGFGLDWQRIDLELTQMADLGAGIPAGSGGPFPQGAGLPFSTDARVKIKGDDASWGYNLGLTYQLQESTRLGLAYRSKISHHITGNATIFVPNNATSQAVAAGGGLTNTKIAGDVTLPENLSFAIHHQVNEQWAVMASTTWTRWSRFQDLTFTTPNPLHPLNKSQPEKWKNTMRYALGLTYIHNDKWTFRSGIAYDETPISDQFRTPRIPGNDRKWIALGASYKYSDNITIDTAYTHIFVNNPSINDTNSNGYTVSGEFDASVDILGVQMRWLFI